jgi:hypothetical protein
VLLDEAAEVGVQVQGLDKRRFAHLDARVDLALGAGDE